MCTSRIIYCRYTACIHPVEDLSDDDDEEKAGNESPLQREVVCRPQVDAIGQKKKKKNHKECIEKALSFQRPIASRRVRHGDSYKIYI